MKRKPTVFIVSQRTSSIQDADSILVLDDGKIAGKGTHEELIASCDIYREIYETQFKKEEAQMAEQKAAGKRKSTMKKVWYYLKNYRFLLIVSVVMAAVTVAYLKKARL